MTTISFCGNSPHSISLFLITFLCILIYLPFQGLHPADFCRHLFCLSPVVIEDIYSYCSHLTCLHKSMQTDPSSFSLLFPKLLSGFSMSCTHNQESKGQINTLIDGQAGFFGKLLPFFLAQIDGLMVAVLNFMNSLKRIYHLATWETSNSHNHMVGQTGKSSYSQCRDRGLKYQPTLVYYGRCICWRQFL